jgi:hypothetical protein
MGQRLKYLVVVLVGLVAFACKDFSGSGSAGGNTPGPVAGPGHALFGPGDTSLVASVYRSTLIFDATVLSFDTTHIAPGQKHRRMRVLVDSILREPSAMDDFSGDTVAVLSSDSAGLAPGGRAVFFSYGLLAGSELVTQEVRRTAVSSDPDVHSVRALLAQADSALTDLEIADASNRSDGVVLMRVDSVFDVEVPDTIARRGSEHTPEWKLAVGPVIRMFRAQDSALATHYVHTLFAAGRREIIDSAPQLGVGGSQILWLHRLARLTPMLRAGIDTTQRFFVLDPADARAAADTSRVANAIATQGGRGGGRGGGPAQPPAGGPPPSGDLQ